MNVTVIGTGYVGLVTGAGFAEMGNTVTYVDVDNGKIEELKHGVLPIYEPGLDHMVAENMGQGRLRFTSSVAEAASCADIFFIAVGTPFCRGGRTEPVRPGKARPGGVRLHRHRQMKSAGAATGARLPAPSRLFYAI